MTIAVILQIGVSGPEKAKMAANYVPTSVVNYNQLIFTIINASTELSENCDEDALNPFEWDQQRWHWPISFHDASRHPQEVKALSGGRWSWVGQPKEIHTDVEFAMNEVLLLLCMHKVLWLLG